MKIQFLTTDEHGHDQNKIKQNGISQCF